MPYSHRPWRGFPIAAHPCSGSAVRVLLTELPGIKDTELKSHGLSLQSPTISLFKRIVRPPGYLQAVELAIPAPLWKSEIQANVCGTLH